MSTRTFRRLFSISLKYIPKSGLSASLAAIAPWLPVTPGRAQTRPDQSPNSHLTVPQPQAVNRSLPEGRLAEAEADYLEAIPTLENRGSASSLAAVLNGLAVVYTRESRFSEAEKLLLRALSADPNAPGSTAAVYRNNLAEVFRQTGRWSEAEASYRYAIRLYGAARGDHPVGLSSVLSNLGVLYLSQGKARKAEPLLKEALRMEAADVPDHGKLVGLFNNLASVELALGRRDSARNLYRRALSLAEHHFGPQHLAAAQTLNNLAGLALDETDL